MTRVAVDAMGGDYAPDEIVKGGVLATQKGEVEVLLVGPTSILETELKKYDTTGLPLTIVEASEVIKEGESPVMALRRKPGASVAVATRLVAKRAAEAMVTMGPTGAAMVSALHFLGTFKGIERPAAAAPFLGLAPHTIVIDCGANVDCKPVQLLNFAVIGSVFVKKFLNVPNPTVALLSIGVEEGKGNQVVRKAYELFKKSGLNFIGNVEGNDIPAGKANVVVCDGFVGNILFKFCESLGPTVAHWLKDNLDGHLPTTVMENLTGRIISLTDTTEVYGGGPLLGVDGVVIVGHGRSRAPGVAKAIHMAKFAVEMDFVTTLKSELTRSRLLRRRGLKRLRPFRIKPAPSS